MRIITRHASALAVVLVAASFVGCSGEDEATKAGGSSGPVTLQIGTDDFPGKPASDEIKEFARQVDQASEGELQIKPVWHAAGDGPNWDQRNARLVTSGELDMGLIPSRSWDTEGVTSLRAINAPFLITSNELLNEVVSGDLAGELMSGLGEAGVVGLALFPEDMRHPFGLNEPLLGPGDYAGEAIRTPTSQTTSAVFAALGATANDEEPNAKIHAGLESGYLQEPPGTATGNVTFYPKVNVLVINQDVLDDLDDGQVEALEEAAAQTREWAIETIPTDSEAAAAFCEDGRRIALASDGEIAALEQALQPINDELASDEQTASIIEAIEGLKAQVEVTATAPASCGGPEAVGGPGSGGDESSLNGVYRFEVTDEDLREAGVTDPAEIAENHGVITYTLKDGSSCWDQQAPNPVALPDSCERYTLDGNRLIFHYAPGDREVYAWKLLPNGDLKQSVISAPLEEEVARAWVANTWIRIGDAE